MTTTPDDYPMVLTVNHVAEIMGIGLNKAYEMMRNPKFPVIREGRRLIIPRDAFLRWMDAGYTQNNILNPPLKHPDKLAERDRVTDICTRALGEAVKSGTISIQEVVTWAFSVRLGK